MTARDALLDETAEELYESAPCGYVSTDLDGLLVRVNRTFEELIGMSRAELLGRRRFQDLLAGGGRIYHETHFAPLLRMQGTVREIALELVRADGTRVPVLVNAALRTDADGRPRAVRVTVFDATDRRRYEEELLRARDREHEIAHDLQRSLLSGELPRTAAVRAEVAYRPAVRGLEVGGDWYDAFWLDAPDTLGLVVGDVVGRGIEAAATMGQLRSAVRALASTGLPPGALLEALDRYARRHGVGQMATLVYGELDVAAKRLRFACAGHPPPAVVGPGAPAQLDWSGRSLPLDAHATIHPRAEGNVSLGAGGRVALYTDGLIERRDTPLRRGLELLVEAVDRHRDAAPEAFPGAVVHDLTADAPRGDDVCLLAVTLTEEVT